MNIIIDSNILFSALIKDSKTREIIKDIDPDDVVFIAYALAYPNAIIW